MKTLTKKMKKTPVIAIAALFGLGLMAGEASANIVLATSNVTPQLGATSLNLDLDGTLIGPQILKTFTAGGLVRVIFNAEATIAGGPATWLDDTIFIDGIPCTPSDSDNALVSGAGGATRDDGWVSAVTQCYRVLPFGVHNIRVQVTPVNPGNAAWRVDDLSLVIDTQ